MDNLDLWREDPEFNALDDDTKRGIYAEYFDQNLADDEFRELPMPEQNAVFGRYLQAQGMLSAKQDRISPILERGKEVVSDFFRPSFAPEPEERVEDESYFPTSASEVSTITGKPIPTPEEKAAGGKAAMAIVPYGFASAVRGMIPEAAEKAIMQPITKALLGKDYVSPVSEAQKIGKYLPEGVQKAIGTPAQMAGAVVPLSIAFKTANAVMKAAKLPVDLVLTTGPVTSRIAGHIVRGSIAGATYGALEEGTPKGMAEDAAFFGALEGGLGAVGGIFKEVFSSNWYRNLEVKERGLVVQTVDDMLKAGHSEGTILRSLSNPKARKQFYAVSLQKRMPSAPAPSPTIPEKQIPTVPPMEMRRGKAPVTSKPVSKLPPGQGFGLFTEEEAAVRRPMPYSPELAKKLQRSQILPPGQGFKLVEPKPEVRLRPSPEKIEGPTYPEGAEYVAGKPASEKLLVEYKPILTQKGTPWKNKGSALFALKSQKRLKDIGVTEKTHKMVPIDDGFGIVRKTDTDLLQIFKKVRPERLKKLSEKVRTETPTMLKESDKVNDVTLGTLVDAAIKNPEKAIEHAAEATVSKAKLIEGLKNKGLKAMGEAKSKEERAEIAKNLEKTLRGIEEGKELKEPTIRIPEFKNTEEALAFGKTATPEQIETLKAKRKESLSKSDALKEKKDLQGAMDEAVRGQFFREAIEMSEGKIVEPKESQKPTLSETKARLLKNIKSEKGSSELINDLSRLGADAMRRGHTTYKAFTAEMKTTLGDVWAKIKHLMLKVYSTAKKILKSERGAVDIGKGKKKYTAEEMKATQKAAKEKAKERFDIQVKKIKTAKDIIKSRREKIRAIKDYFLLSDSDLRKITKRDIRLMSNFEFKKFIDDIRAKAEKFAERRQAVNELELLRKEKAFISEDNIRKFHKLPTIKKMTTQQLTEYTKILSGYEKSDQFLTPKRVKGIEKTLWSGSNTVREVLEKASKEFDIPMLELTKVRVHEIDRFRYDTSLARQNPFYNFMVDTINIARIKNQFKYFKEREKLYKLGKLALKSRKRGLVGRLVPRQKELMKYMEAEGDAKTEAALKLTTEEMALADAIEDFYRRAYNWLLINQELKSSRFLDSKYVFHSKRPLSELLIDLKDTGIKSAAKDLLNRWRLDEAQFKILDSKTGEILRMKKFFRQTLYRTGELTPTKNVIKATDIYMQQFFNKMALDESVPAIETLAVALRPKEKTKTGVFLNDSLMTFVKEYLNNKKGRTLNIGIQQGGKIDTAIRFVNQIVSLRYIALNIPLEFAAIVGETTAKLPALGNRKLTLANWRRHTPQGKRILKKYKAYTGEGVLEEVFQPARNIGENINMALYGLFKWSRKVTKQDILLGNMTKAEFEAETIDPKKLAEATKMTGRWLDIEGAKSIMGGTSTGAAITKFKGWAIPIVSSTIQDANSLARTLTRLGDPKKRLTQQQFQELYRIAEMGAILVAISSLLDTDEDKDTFAGRLKYYAIRELGTLYNALTPRTMLTFGVTIAFLEKLSQNLYLLMTCEKYKTRDELKGVAAMKKQLTPAAISQFKGKKPQKKTGRLTGGLSSGGLSKSKLSSGLK